MKEDYIPLRPITADSSQDLEHVEDESIDPLVPTPGRRTKRAWPWRGIICGTILLLSSTILSALAGGYISYRIVNLDQRCAAHTTQYSQIIKEADVRYEFRVFNGSFMEENIYRRQGSPEVDAAWDALGINYHAAAIPLEEGLRSGLTTGHVQRAAAYGGGFFVNVEGLHHLHCLNLARKALYFNYEYYKDLGTNAFSNEERILRKHVTHCIDIVRQVLMCNVDTGVFGQVWAHLDGENTSVPSPFPDFNTRHKCKNYDDVRQWAQRMQEPPPESLPHDYAQLPSQDDVLPKIP